MKNLLKQLIIDFHKREIPKPSLREISLPELPTGVKKAYVFIGMRRSGKTWTMYQQIHQLMDNGIPLQQIIYLNFEDDRLEDLSGKDLQLIFDAYFELYPENIQSQQLHFFFDEIHEVQGWEKFIRRTLDTEPIQLYLSGSSAKMLSKEIASSLRGRTITREIFPYNFREYLIHKKISFSNKPSSKEKASLAAYAHQFITFGGFPETVGTKPSLHRELLQGYIDTVIYRDIIDRYNVTNTASLKRLLTYCLQNSSNLFSVNKVYQTLKSLGYAVSKNTLYQFMEYLQDAYCIFSIDPFHPSFKKSHQKPKKIYPVDQGLITAYGWNEIFCQGTRLEAAIFSHLKRSYGRCFYFHTQDKREVDLVAVSPENKIDLIQVSLTMKQKSTRDREIRALRSAMKELSIDQGTIVTLDDPSDSHTFEEGKVEIMPSWCFLLNHL